MTELNPNHPVTRQVHDHWHKVAAILMMRLGVDSYEVTEEDVLQLGDNQRGVVADLRGGRFVVRLVTMEEGERMAREAGGLPV
jgi:hypothetical protein